MAATQSDDIDTPLSILMERIRRTGEGIVLTEAGRPVVVLSPVTETASGYGMLNAHAPKGTSVSIDEMNQEVVAAAVEEFSS